MPSDFKLYSVYIFVLCERGCNVIAVTYYTIVFCCLVDPLRLLLFVYLFIYLAW